MVLTPAIVLNESASHLAGTASPPVSAQPCPDAQAARLSAAVSRGDESAFEELYDLYRDRVFRLLFVLTRGDDSLAHQLAQAVMLTAAAKLKPVQTQAHLWNWLARVAHQQLLKEWRRTAREPALLPLSEIPETPAAIQPDRYLEEKLDAALQALDPSDRQILEWFYFDGLHQNDIAECLSTTRKAAASRMERARAKLRSLLTNLISHENR